MKLTALSVMCLSTALLAGPAKADFTTPEQAQQFIDNPSGYSSCTVSSDCVVTGDSCSKPVAINGMSKLRYDEMARIAGAVISCVMPEPIDPSLKVACVSGTCQPQQE